MLLRNRLQSYFYPRPPRGGRRSGTRQVSTSAPFLSTPSAGRATLKAERSSCRGQFLSTPSAGRATGNLLSGTVKNWISIHALRGEGDCPIHIPPSSIKQFLSTPSAGRATFSLEISSGVIVDFYPRPPRGGRRLAGRAGHCIVAISIHALRGEGDANTPLCCCRLDDFYPRPPRGGRLA